MGGGRWLVACAALATAGCTTASASRLEVATTTSTATSAASTTVPPASTVAPLPSGPDAYAQALVQAWVGGDHPREEQLATADVVTQLDAHDADRPAGWVFVNCEGTAGSSYCTFAAGQQQLIVRVLNEAAATGQEHGVIEVRFESGLAPGL